MDDKTLHVDDLRTSNFNISLSGSRKLPDGGHQMSTEQWQLVLQVRILRELQKLNTLLHCHNFIGIPQTLRDIKRATNRIPTIARPRKPKVKK